MTFKDRIGIDLGATLRVRMASPGRPKNGVYYFDAQTDISWTYLRGNRQEA
jgi:hypothetical protein